MPDIVNRLRETGGLDASLHNQAADEIERLRKGGCARDQNTTQFCAEAVRLQQERDQALKRLFAEENACDIERRENERITADRDNLERENQRLRQIIDDLENIFIDGDSDAI